MLPEENELLKRSVSLAEDNNNILHSMRRSMRWARVMSVIYWLFIIGSAVGAYYFIQPYLTQVMNLYGGASDVLKNFKQ